MKVQQVFLNLASFLLNSMKRGSIKISVSYNQHQPSLVVDLKETGTGMKSQEIKEFQKRLQESTAIQQTRQEDGLISLELANVIARVLSKRLNRGIQIEHEPSTGNTYRFFLNTELQRESFTQINLSQSIQDTFIFQEEQISVEPAHQVPQQQFLSSQQPNVPFQRDLNPENQIFTAARKPNGAGVNQFVSPQASPL